MYPSTFVKYPNQQGSDHSSFNKVVIQITIKSCQKSPLPDYLSNLPLIIIIEKCCQKAQLSESPDVAGRSHSTVWNLRKLSTDYLSNLPLIIRSQFQQNGRIPFNFISGKTFNIKILSEMEVAPRFIIYTVNTVYTIQTALQCLNFSIYAYIYC